jgi:hypothetical protein
VVAIDPQAVFSNQTSHLPPDLYSWADYLTVKHKSMFQHKVLQEMFQRRGCMSIIMSASSQVYRLTTPHIFVLHLTVTHTIHIARSKGVGCSVVYVHYSASSVQLIVVAYHSDLMKILALP